MAAFGLVAVERGRDPGDEGGSFELWPENVQSLRLWLEVATQWRVGMGGAVGLDYAGVEAVMRINGLRGQERRERFGDLRVMEAAALRAWAAAREARGG